MKQQTGKMPQMSDTCLHDSIAPRPNTENVPKLVDVIVIVVIIPRKADSLEKWTQINLKPNTLFSEDRKRSSISNYIISLT